MKNKFSVKGFLVNLLMVAFIVSIGASQGSPITGLIVGVTLFALALAKPWLPMIAMSLFGTTAGFAGDSGVTTCGIDREIWENHLVENIYPGNEFLLAMTDESEYVNFLTVHSPQAVGTPNVVKNRDLSGPGPVNTNTRVDVTLDWSIDEYTTDPFKITNAEEVQLSYSKRESILYNQEMKIRKVIADNVIVDIAATGTAVLPADYGGGTNNNILRSTGITNNDITNIQSSLAYTAGAAGNRLNFTVWDVQAAGTHLDSLDVPMEGRAMLMSARAYAQIRLDLIATKYRDYSETVDPTTGRISRTLLGFEIFMRSNTCTYNNVAVPVVNPVGTAGSATDNDAILFWQRAACAKAVGDVHVYNDENSAVYYGDVYSGLIRMGAHKARISEVGVGAIVQSAAA